MTEDDRTRDAEERDRLLHGAGAQAPAGIGTDLIVVRTRDVEAATVIERAREVLLVVNEQIGHGWLTDEEWRSRLPEWFVRRCAPEPSSREVESRIKRWWAMAWPQKQRDMEERRDSPWPLSNWLHFFKPGEPHEREWRWWDAAVIDERNAEVRIEVIGWPYAWDALQWLLLAAGANSVEAEE